MKDNPQTNKAPEDWLQLAPQPPSLGDDEKGWKLATVAEVQLVRATTLFRKAVMEAPTNVGSGSTRTPAVRLLRHLQRPEGEQPRILAAFVLGAGT